jgi:gamma-glutamylcyclotransferase (GGCT)/AIG2-like uncharacterized protein YtfP
MNIFAYGSLMFPSVMQAVTGCEFPSRKARVRNYARFKVKGESYPGITLLEGAVTEGVLYLNVDTLSVRRLDDFEGDLYERVEMQADAFDGESLTAHAYVIKTQHRDQLSSAEWDLEHFEKADLIQFMASYRGFLQTDPSDRSDPTDPSDHSI